jgi:glyoxylase-like metal-dependent hydrolase (beta-lactamase superfamily II)
MRVREPGRIREGLWYLGAEESCVYVLEGRGGSMMISGGMSYLVPDLLLQMEEFGIDEDRITKLLILHAHFDHVGVVPYFKRRHPEMEIYASARGWEILTWPKAIKTINAFGRQVAQKMGREGVYDRYDLEWRDDVIGTAVTEGDRIDLGDLEVRIFETPGHSSCSITAYVPQFKALFASDGGGIPYKDTIVTSGNSNYTRFQESLEKLQDLSVDYVCADHYGYVAGEEARSFLQRAGEMARQRRRLMEETYRRTGSIEEAARQLADDFYRENPDYLLSKEIFEAVFRQMIRNVTEDLAQRPQG